MEVTLASVHQFLKRKGLNHTLHRLEREVGKFFDRDHVFWLLREGKFVKAIKYLEGFILPPNNTTAPASPDEPPANGSQRDDQVALKIFHDLHLQRYLEAIYHHERYEAFKILQSDLRYMLERSNFEHYKFLVDLLSTDRIPENIAKNFVSSRDAVQWHPYANDYFIPQMKKAFDSHPQIRNSHQVTEGLSYRQKEEPMDEEGNTRNSQTAPLPPPSAQIQPPANLPLLNERAGLKQFHELAVCEAPFFSMATSRKALGAIDRSGKIFIFDIQIPNLPKIARRHKEYNRMVLPSADQVASHYSIEFSKNESFVCATAGGPASIYSVDKTCPPIPVSSQSSVTQVIFDPDDGTAVVLGLRDGTTALRREQAEGQKSLALKLHESPIIALTKRRHIVASVCSGGRFCVYHWKGKERKVLQNSLLPRWHPQAASTMHLSLEFALFEDKLQLLLGLPSVFYIFDILNNQVSASSTVRVPPTYQWIRTIFHHEYILCASDRHIFIYQRSGTGEQPLLTKVFPVHGNKITELSSHPEKGFVFAATACGKVLSMELHLP